MLLMVKINMLLSEQIKHFERWQKELEAILADTDNVFSKQLTQILYKKEDCDKLVGGIAAPVFKDAVVRIKFLQEALDKEKEKNLQLTKDVYLYQFNLGTHYYPGCGPLPNDRKFFYTSDCLYCDCWMGSYRSGDNSKKGIDPFGECPGNPKVKTRYEEIKEKYSEIVKDGHKKLQF